MELPEKIKGVLAVGLHPLPSNCRWLADAGLRIMTAINRDREITHLSDVPLEVEVELDRHAATIQDVLQLAAGSILTLNKAAGEPVEIRIGGTYVGVGEIIAFNDNAGVRISDLSAEQ
jgi:flagellar motor switch protein FliN